jgi:hypothetical protein
MSLYSVGIIFTMGFIMSFDDEAEDSWKHALGFLFLAVSWPLYWGIQAGDIAKKTFNTDAFKNKGSLDNE